MAGEIIGRGTWLDKIADKVIKKEKREHTIGLLRVESGLGASGLPHLGSFADAARAFGIKLALEDAGYPSEYIAFSDDTDGLRKVPAGLPRELKKYLGYPVSDIPDPFKCHDSFGAHMSSLLLEALDKSGITYRFISAADAYKAGLFGVEIKKILDNARQVGEIIKRESSQEKYLESLPYFPICKKCGRIYTTEAYKWNSDQNLINYRCKGAIIRGSMVKGCGYEGEVDYRIGQGKLSWKVEFAARWSALNINFEAHGKDIADSVRVNDIIMKEVLGKPPPYHVQYEMFLDKSGAKISKSAGNVFTPQVWFRYGSPNSLLLLMFKRITGTRELSIEDIPKYMDELDWLEDIYFDKKSITDPRELAKLKGLYEYTFLLKPPMKPSIHIPYNLLLNLVSVAPQRNTQEFVVDKLRKYEYPINESVLQRIAFTINWVHDFMPKDKGEWTFSTIEVQALKTIAEQLGTCRNEDEIQNVIFTTAKSHDIPIKRIFKILYRVLLGKEYGPKLGPYIFSSGVDETIKKLESISS